MKKLLEQMQYFHQLSDSYLAKYFLPNLSNTISIILIAEYLVALFLLDLQAIFVTNQIYFFNRM
jgi:hypothetical protein